jgi:hypothetical protein
MCGLLCLSTPSCYFVREPAGRNAVPSVGGTGRASARRRPPRGAASSGLTLRPFGAHQPAHTARFSMVARGLSVVLCGIAEGEEQLDIS